MTTPDVATQIDRLASEQAIIRNLKLYCRAVDRRDEALLRSLYHVDAYEEHGVFSGRATDFCDWVMPFLQRCECSTHQLSNILVDIDGDHAVSEAYFITYSIGVTEAPAEKFDLTIAGRYLDRFERRHGEWRIAHRQVVIDWSNKLPSHSRGSDALSRQWARGTPFADDLLYRLVPRGAPSVGQSAI